MEIIKEALTFDDILLEPQYSNVLPIEAILSQKLSKKLFLKLPFLSAAMDTVTESKMAISLARLGGIGVIHRNLNINNQIKEVEKVKKNNLASLKFFQASNFVIFSDDKVTWLLKKKIKII